MATTYKIEVEREAKAGKLKFHHGNVVVNTNCWWALDNKIDAGSYTCSATWMSSKPESDGQPCPWKGNAKYRPGIWFGMGVKSNDGSKINNEIFIHKGTGPAYSEGCIVCAASEVLKIWNAITPKDKNNVIVVVKDKVFTNQKDAPKWGIIDLFMWKVLPGAWGGGIPYIQKFKDGWVKHNKFSIIEAANRNKFPKELLAGTSWIEVGGDPNFIDKIAFEVRSFDWSGPDWIDDNLTITNRPEKTSFGSVSIQLRTAAQTMGLNHERMTSEQLRNLSSLLQKDLFNINVVAKHLRELIDHDGMQTQPPGLSMEAVRIVGARYNRGIGLPLGKIKKNTSYGDFIVKHWSRFSKLLL